MKNWNKCLSAGLAALLAAAAASPLVFLDRSASADEGAEGVGKGNAAPASTAQIEGWIAELGASDFDTRANASRALQRAGRAAEPALRKALAAGRDPEVRWRLEQLLLRLEGAGERQIGQGDHGGPRPRGPRPEDGGRPRMGEGEERPDSPGAPGARLRQIEEMMREMERRMEDAFGAGDGFQPRGFAGAFPMMQRRTLAAPGLVLEQGGMGPVRLRVQREAEGQPEGQPADQPAGETVYRGRSLAAILERHPELQKHKGMAELQEKLAAAEAQAEADPGFEALRDLFGQGGINGSNSMGFGITLDGMGIGSQRVEIHEDHEGARVRIRKQGEDGKEEVQEFKGENLEAIKKAHPELEQVLGGFRVQIRGPRFFWGQDGRRDDPLRRLPDGQGEVAPPATPTVRKPFGIEFRPLDVALGAQLGLAEGTGALVANVLPGSAAEAVGLQRYDVLLSVDETPIVAGSDLRALLQPKADTAEPLRLGIVRRGVRMELTR